MTKDLWTYISDETRIDRHICKQVIFALLYSGTIIAVCKRNALIIEEVADIRMAFNDWITKNCKRPKNDMD